MPSLPRLREATRFSIAREMAARGDNAGALKEFRAMQPHLERELGPDHPATLTAAEWIANVKYDQSKGSGQAIG